MLEKTVSTLKNVHRNAIFGLIFYKLYNFGFLSCRTLLWHFFRYHDIFWWFYVHENICVCKWLQDSTVSTNEQRWASIINFFSYHSTRQNTSPHSSVPSLIRQFRFIWSSTSYHSHSYCLAPHSYLAGPHYFFKKLERERKKNHINCAFDSATQILCAIIRFPEPKTNFKSDEPITSLIRCWQNLSIN